MSNNTSPTKVIRECNQYLEGITPNISEEQFRRFLIKQIKRLALSIQFRKIEHENLNRRFNKSQTHP